jgi:acetolactate synthase-1/2/3 large subunit
LHLGPALPIQRRICTTQKKRGRHCEYRGRARALSHQYDTPLTADIEGIARPFSHWVKTSPTSKTVAADGALAIQAARVAPGQIATLILPADTAWVKPKASPTRGYASPAWDRRNDAVVAAAKFAEARQFSNAVSRWPGAASAWPRTGRQDRC